MNVWFYCRVRYLKKTNLILIYGQTNGSRYTGTVQLTNSVYSNPLLNLMRK